MIHIAAFGGVPHSNEDPEPCHPANEMGAPMVLFVARQTGAKHLLRRRRLYRPWQKVRMQFNGRGDCLLSGVLNNQSFSRRAGAHVQRPPRHDIRPICTQRDPCMLSAGYRRRMSS